MSKIITESSYELNKLFYIDSRDRNFESDGITLQPVSNFTLRYNIQETNCSYISVQQASFTAKLLNINEYNDKLKIDGVVYTLRQGYYSTPSLLITQINTDIALSLVTCALAPTTSDEIKCRFSKGIAFTLQPGNTNCTKQGQFQLFDMLGFDKTILTGALTYTGKNEINIFPTRYVDCCSTRLSQYRGSDLSSDISLRNGLFRMPIDNLTIYPNIVYENKILYKYRFEKSEQIGQLDFQLYDEYNNLLTYLMADYTITLFLFKETMTKTNFYL